MKAEAAAGDECFDSKGPDPRSAAAFKPDVVGGAAPTAVVEYLDGAVVDVVAGHCGRVDVSEIGEADIAPRRCCFTRGAPCMATVQSTLSRDSGSGSIFQSCRPTTQVGRGCLVVEIGSCESLQIRADVLKQL